MRKTFIELSRQELLRDPHSRVLLGDISVGGFMDANEQLVPGVLNMGIAEQAMIAFAAGISYAGHNVIVHTIAAFLVERAFEQIKLACGYNQCRLILTSANGPYDYDRLGPTHHCPSDVSLMATVPNLDIRVPATVEDVRECYAEALDNPHSTYIRLTSRSAKLPCEPIREGAWKKIYIRSGEASCEYQGQTQAVICIGESLTYWLSQKMDQDVALYWTADPRAVVPDDVECFQGILVLEPYTVPMLSAPVRAERRTFSIQPKKLITANMGWEDFE